MSTRLVIPQGARLECADEGAIPFGPNKGGPYLIRLWTGYASHGFRTDYQHIPKRWLEVCWQDAETGKRRRFAWGYSGKRFDKGMSDYLSNLEAVRGQAVSRG